MNIFFDMDGTIVDFYGVEGWLEAIRSFDPYPYQVAKPLIRLSDFARQVNRLQREGAKISIISWLAKTSNPNYDQQVISAKRHWLYTHLPSVSWDHFYIIPHGTPKSNFAEPFSILFDDEVHNRDEWSGIAYDATDIMEVLKQL